MRTADRVLARQWATPRGMEGVFDSPEFRNSVARAVKDATVVVADNVARYVHDRNEEIKFETYPTLAPPWPMFWVEYPSSSGRERRGVLVIEATSVVLEEGFDPSEGPLYEWANVAYEDATLTNGHARADVRWIFTMLLFVESDRQVWGPAGSMSLALDEHGKVIGNGWSLAPVEQLMSGLRERSEAASERSPDLSDLSDLPLKEQYEQAVADLEDRRALAEDTGAWLKIAELCLEEARGDDKRVAFTPDWLWRALTPTMQTIAFLHCRNVETAAFDAPPKVQHKRRKKGQRPLVRYHTLRLEVPRRQSDSSGGRYDIGSPALHIVAGHFAHYGACCQDHEPHGRLFGRLEGVYWVPTHARGDAQRGVVRTDFDVVAPE